MPYTLKPNKLFVKDPNGEGYLPQNVITDRSTAEQIAQLQSQIDALEARVAALEAN